MRGGVSKHRSSRCLPIGKGERIAAVGHWPKVKKSTIAERMSFPRSTGHREPAGEWGARDPGRGDHGRKTRPVASRTRAEVHQLRPSAYRILTLPIPFSISIRVPNGAERSAR